MMASRPSSILLPALAVTALLCASTFLWPSVASTGGAGGTGGREFLALDDLENFSRNAWIQPPWTTAKLHR